MLDIISSIENVNISHKVDIYNCKVKRVCRARNDAFYLAGN